ncbi:MAG: hypothetical protein WCI41_01165 [bacterium]
MSKTKNTEVEIPTIIIAQGLIDVDFIQKCLEENFPFLRGKLHCTKNYEEVIRFIPSDGKIIIITGTYLKSSLLTDKVDAYTLSKYVKNLNRDIKIHLLSAYPPEDKNSFDSWIHKSGHATKEEILDKIIEALTNFKIIKEEEKEKEENFFSFLKKLFYMFSPAIFLLLLFFCFASCSSNDNKIKNTKTEDTLTKTLEIDTLIFHGNEIKNVKLTKNSVTFWFSEEQLYNQIREQEYIELRNKFRGNFVKKILFTYLCYGKQIPSINDAILVYVGDSLTKTDTLAIDFNNISSSFNPINRVTNKIDWQH